jgi:hypothetical protein
MVLYSDRTVIHSNIIPNEQILSKLTFEEFMTNHAQKIKKIDSLKQQEMHLHDLKNYSD